MVVAHSTYWSQIYEIYITIMNGELLVHMKLKVLYTVYGEWNSLVILLLVQAGLVRQWDT